MKRSLIITLCLCLLISFSFADNCFAGQVENEKVYKPLDLVVVIDSSGSMRESDTNRTALDAVRMLVNMMPAKDSRVGIISFNTSPSILTKDASGNNCLISLEDYTGVETIRSDVSTINYSGDTGIGNAIKAATELLDSCSDDNHTKAIILFTDGVDDFGRNRVALAACEENEVDAIKWAKDNNCFIYCVGYDYITSSGTSSMGSGGEGLKKLQNIAGSTGGAFKAIDSIDDIEQLLIEFLADVCDLNYKTIASIPGDGAYHECVIPVSPSVIEANIRIASSGQNAIEDGTIKLYDPTGKEIQLANSGNIRYDRDATAASIKVIMPKSGEWILTVEGISGEDIHVGLLEHFKMNLASQLIFPEENPDGVAYTNDVVGIKTWLTYDNSDLDNDDIYDAVTDATATCVSRANPDDKKVIQLKREGRSFVGSFTIPEDCYYDITIRLDWDTVYREDTLTIMSSNSPVKLVKDIDDVKVNKGKTITLDNIYQYVQDEENDPIEVRVKGVTTEDVADITIKGDQIEITGVKGWWAKTLVTLEYVDIHGNTVETSFKVKVGDPSAWLIIIGGILLLALIGLLILYLMVRATVRIPGEMKVELLAKGFIDGAGDFVNTEEIYRNPNELSKDKYTIRVKPAVGPVGVGPNRKAFERNEGVFSPPATGMLRAGNGSAYRTTSSSRSGAFEKDRAADSESKTGLFNRGGQSVADDRLSEEMLKSNRFNATITLSDRYKKKSLYFILSDFMIQYGHVMNESSRSSILYKRVEGFVNESLKTVLDEVMVYGTPFFGKRGMILEKPMRLRDGLVFHNPIIDKKKVRLNPDKRDFEISISIISGDKDNEGNIPVNHILIKYFN